jgi:hypothetical protein
VAWGMRSSRWQACKPLYANIASLLGLALIGYAMTRFTSQTQFPDTAALLPAAGTMLLVLYCIPGTIMYRLLTLPPLVGVGRISYSAYLWHYPIFVFARLYYVAYLPVEAFAIMIMACFMLSYLSWKYVEMPCRDPKRVGNRTFMSAIGICVVFCLALQHIVATGKGFPDRLTPEMQRLIHGTATSPKRAACHMIKWEGHWNNQEACRFFGEKIQWAVWGDSTVPEVAYALATRLEQDNIGVAALSYSAAGWGLSDRRFDGAPWMERAMEYIIADTHIQNVVLLYNHARYARNFETEDIGDGLAHTLYKVDPEQYWTQLQSQILRLRAAGKRVFVGYSTPRLPLPATYMIMRGQWHSRKDGMGKLEGSTRRLYDISNHFIETKLASLPWDEQLIPIRIGDILCDEAYCYAADQETSYYYDITHLSLSGAALIADNILEAYGRIISGESYKNTLQEPHRMRTSKQGYVSVGDVNE